MMNGIIHRYKLKDGATIEKITKEFRKRHIPLKSGGTYINKNAAYCTFKNLADDISVNIAFPEDLSEWDDFEYVLVLDENFGQPYTPFYESKEPFMFLLNVIGRYNKFMDSLSFLERR